MIRYASNIVFVLVLAAFALALWLGEGRLSPEWVRLLSAGAGSGLALHLLGRVFGKPHAPCQLRTDTRRASYVFGYWVAVVAILGAAAAAHFGVIRAETALPLLGLALIAPTLFTAWVQFRS